MRLTAILFIAALLLVPCMAQADISPCISYQGVLRDGSGNPVLDGSYLVTFRIYDAETGGTALWTENQTLTATGGIINAHMGSVTPLDIEFDVPYWLGISVEGGAELVPRAALTTVPSAVHAAYADRCTEGDDDWQTSGDDIYHDVGNVGIGTWTPEARLDVLGGGEAAARFQSSSSGSSFAVEGRNLGGTAGGFLAGSSIGVSPAIPAAIFAYAGPGYRGAHVSAQDDIGLFAHSVDNTAVYGWSTNAYSGHFTGGLGVKVDGMMRSNELQVLDGAVAGYVLTSSTAGVATWQPAGTGGDSDWTINGSDMYSGVTGRVGIGASTPSAKLEVYNAASWEALVVEQSGAISGRMVNIEMTVAPSPGNDILQIKVPTGSPDNFQFIECENAGANRFVVDGDGFVKALGGVEGSVAAGEVGDHYGVFGLVYGGNDTNYGVYGAASAGAYNYGVYGYAYNGTHYAGYFSGNAHVTDTFTAGIKSFKIDHPLDPENKYLVHSCVESDDMMNIYNGNVTLDGRGEAQVEMPEWFEALNQDFRYQLTAIGAPGPNLYVAEEIGDNRFRIAGGEPGMKVSWMVTGVRHDPLAVASRMVVEVDKPAKEVGKYMHPEAYGKPVAMGVDYHEERETRGETAEVERTARPVRDRSDGE